MEPEARDIAEMKREEKRMKRVDGKAAGDYGFITCQRIGLANGACRRHTKRGGW
jgi:hypothetical protein